MNYGQEELLQRALAEHLRLRAKCIYYAVPNGEKRSKGVAGRLKAMGVVAGVPDLMFILPGGQAACLELKSPGGHLRPEQKAFASQALSLGAQHAVAADIDSALSILEQWQVFG